MNYSVWEMREGHRYKGQFLAISISLFKLFLFV